MRKSYMPQWLNGRAADLSIELSEKIWIVKRKEILQSYNV